MVEFTTLREFAAAVHAAWGGTATYQVGAEHLSTDVPAPYVVWVCSAVAHDYGGIDHGPVYDDATEETTKQIVTRRMAVDVHIWATSADAATVAVGSQFDVGGVNLPPVGDPYVRSASDAAEVILLGLMAAAYDIASGSFVTRGETWPKQAAHGHLKRGEPVIWRLTVDMKAGGLVHDTATIGDPPTDVPNPPLDFVDEIT